MIAKQIKVEQRSSTTVRARGMRAEACHCGQQLDTCARSHCPRCGRTRR